MAEGQAEKARITFEVPQAFRLQAHGAIKTIGYETMKDYLTEKLQEAIQQANEERKVAEAAPAQAKTKKGK